MIIMMRRETPGWTGGHYLLLFADVSSHVNRDLRGASRSKGQKFKTSRWLSVLGFALESQFTVAPLELCSTTICFTSLVTIEID